MLNAKQERELCYVVRVDEIKPIPGRDRVECAVVGGWTIMVRKDQFKPGDLGIYFEIDSLVPAKEPFLFLEKCNYRIKTQKYKTPEGQFWSQGLLMSAEDFNWYMNDNRTAIIEMDASNDEGYHAVDNESRFLTKKLGVKYYEPEDNTRKANSVDKYKQMSQRRPDIFRRSWARWMMKREWGRKMMFLLFGKRKDKKSGWPIWVVKTDEERVENMSWILSNKEPWIATEKIDGTSTTFTMKRKPFGRHEFYVCSRNVVFDKPDKQCYYDFNIYTEMAEKYDIENVLADWLAKHPEDEWVTLQGESYGASVQRRDYHMKDHDFAGFNLITSSRGRYNSVEASVIMQTAYDIPWVPIIAEDYVLPDTIAELREFVNSAPSAIDGDMKEGIVFRSADGMKSFKCVSPEFLMKYHG